MSKKIRVAVIFGGRSSEHSISCISAGSVLRALDRTRYEVVPIGITKSGRWVLEADDADRLTIKDGYFPEVDDSNPSLLFTADSTATQIRVETQVPKFLPRFDVAFPILHGPWGEDGTIQGLLELAQIPYVGSGVFASAAAMDKAHLKVMMQSAGLPIGRYEVVTNAQWTNEREDTLVRLSALGLPVFVKPSRAGSSVGISKVKLADDLAAAIEFAREHDPKIIVEASIENAREIECGVLDGEAGPKASVCAEIIVRGGHEFYDFQAKYVDDSVELCVPAQLDPELHEKIRALAVSAFLAMAGEGLARIDMFVSGTNVVINEINTMPGFTPISMYPQMWAHTGLDYPALVDALVQDALRRGVGLR